MEQKAARGNAFTNNPLVKAVGTQKIVIILVILALFTFFGAKSPQFRQYSTIVSILDYSYYISFMAIGVTFVLITGGVDLSIGTGMIACALLGGNFVIYQGWPVAMGMVVCILLGLAFGCFNGLTVAVLDLPPFIATLGSMMIARGLGSIMIGGVSVPWPAVGMPKGWFRSIFKINNSNVLIPMGFLLVILIALLMTVLLSKSRPGRYIFAIGSNKEAARLSGIQVVKWQALAYLICGVFTGLAGIAYAATFQTVVPGIGAGLELDAIAAAIIGGTSMNGGVGTVSGTLLGVFVLALLKTGLPFMGLQANWQQIATGIVLLAAVFIDVWRNAR